MVFGTVLVGSNVLLREGVARVLTTAEFKVVASRACVDDHVVGLLTQENATLLIIDVGDDFGAAIGQIEYFKKQCPAGRVVVLAHQHQFSEMVSAFRAGANAYFVQIATCEAFIKSLELVMLGENVLPPAMLTSIFDHASDRPDGHHRGHRIGHGDRDRVEKYPIEKDRLDDDDSDISSDDGTAMQELPQGNGSWAPHLSPRQKSILICLIEGDSNKIIARKMNLAEATVKVHVKAILRRTRVRNRTQAAIWAMNSGLFLPATDVEPSAAASLSNATPSDLDVADVLPSGLTNGSSPARKPNGASHVALPNLDLLARNGVHRNSH